MSDSDLFGKADGLMRRHAVGTDTAAVPVLTDLIDAPPVAPIDSTLPPHDAGLPAASQPIAALGDGSALEARIMAEVDRRLAEEMERVRQVLAEAVSDAVRQALSDPPVK